MRPNWRSSGVATAEAIVCGSAPGSEAPTLMTGKSILGSEATGRKLKARIPDSRSAAASSDVPIGRRMNGAEILIFFSARSYRSSYWHFLLADLVRRHLLWNFIADFR